MVVAGTVVDVAVVVEGVDIVVVVTVVVGAGASVVGAAVVEHAAAIVTIAPIVGMIGLELTSRRYRGSG